MDMDKPRPDLRLLESFRDAPNVTAIVRMTHRVFAVRYVDGECVVWEVRNGRERFARLDVPGDE